MLCVEMAVAKVPKYAVRESGDSVEVIERPRGGISLVMADGQRSGRSAKAISNIAVRKVISLLAEGIRDGAAARAAHDYLRTTRSGQVSAELTILTVDLETRTVVISRNSQCPVLLAQAGEWQLLDEPATPVGIHERTRPVITEIPLVAGQVLVAFTDGVLHAGSRGGEAMDPLVRVRELFGSAECTAQAMADRLLHVALDLDSGRPQDDITVVVLCVVDDGAPPRLELRRMQVSFPVSPV